MHNATETKIIISEQASEQDLQIIEAVSPFSMTPPERILNTIKSVEYIVENGISGAIVECGVWRGGNMLAVCLKLAALGASPRHIYLYDTFEGNPIPGEKDLHPDGRSAKQILLGQPKDKENHYWAYSPIEDVQRAFEQVGYPPHMLHFVKGLVEETIPATLPGTTALLRLDTDWYDSTLHELVHLYPLLSERGVLILDDYGFWTGCRQAADEFFATLEVRPELRRVRDSVDSAGHYLIK